MQQIYSALLACTLVVVSPLLPAQGQYGQPDAPSPPSFWGRKSIPATRRK